MNKEEIGKTFRRAKILLDSGHYHDAIEIFSSLIAAIEIAGYEDPYAKLTWDTSLNNRGVAKCKLGYSLGDRSLYESGLEDYRTTVNTFDEESRPGLTSYANLVYGEKEIEIFDTHAGINFRNQEI